MKFIKYISILFLAIAFGCTTENMDPVGSFTLTSPTIDYPSGESIVLDSSASSTIIEFSWEAAECSERYDITYEIAIDTGGSSSFDSPITTITANNDGSGTTAEITYDDLDEALSIAGYKANAEVSLSWVIIANCVGTIVADTAVIRVTRFNEERYPTTLYLTGGATENGSNLDSAIVMTKLSDDANVWQAYNTLTTSGGIQFYSNTELPAYIYGGIDGTLSQNGNNITVSEDGIYQITVDLDNNTYELLKIDRLGVIGSCFTNGWDSDEELEYLGNGVWESEIKFISTGEFGIRLKESWDYVYKLNSSTTNQLVSESVGDTYGIEYENIPSEITGTGTITVSLSEGNYTYSINMTEITGDEIQTPESLYLLDKDNTLIGEFTKNEDVFTSTTYLALQSSVSYTLNSASDGSGTSYSLSSYIGAADDTTTDQVSGTSVLVAGSSNITIEKDQAYSLTVDFSSGSASWYYYNMKVYQWDNDGGWDDRYEYQMTYSHPYTFSVTESFTAGFDMKFYSPWEVEFGAKDGVDDASAMKGTTTNKNLQDDDTDNNNFNFITSDGTYTITLVVDDDYKTGTYTTSSN